MTKSKLGSSSKRIVLFIFIIFFRSYLIVVRVTYLNFARGKTLSNRLLEESIASTRNGLQATLSALQALRVSPLQDFGLVLTLEQMAKSACTTRRFTAHRADLAGTL